MKKRYKTNSRVIPKFEDGITMSMGDFRIFDFDVDLLDESNELYCIDAIEPSFGLLCFTKIDIQKLLDESEEIDIEQ